MTIPMLGPQKKVFLTAGRHFKDSLGGKLKRNVGTLRNTIDIRYIYIYDIYNVYIYIYIYVYMLFLCCSIWKTIGDGKDDGSAILVISTCNFSIFFLRENS